VSGERPTPGDALREYLTSETYDGVREMTVRCSGCRTRVGTVVAHEHGPLWIGELKNRPARRVRARRGAPRVNLMPMWLDTWRAAYYCECGCRRNHAQGQLVWSAWQSRRQDVVVPVPAE
jgi:hypothetical protein